MFEQGSLLDAKVETHVAPAATSVTWGRGTATRILIVSQVSSVGTTTALGMVLGIGITMIVVKRHIFTFCQPGEL